MYFAIVKLHACDARKTIQLHLYGLFLPKLYRSYINLILPIQCNDFIFNIWHYYKYKLNSLAFIRLSQLITWRDLSFFVQYLKNWMKISRFDNMSIFFSELPIKNQYIYYKEMFFGFFLYIYL